ncbi:hypothetical protein BIW11_02045 [Tropilaelaps mercedesae]|uniref:Uncharacterized protein n=1 Tax=Tropilaelaps mercedesae TaxID=418985 RepID=A0A1V9X4I2_9ACAR|nr:hypothetical protein BIW11_02045 [Tropilaelaps mercedesae]
MGDGTPSQPTSASAVFNRTTFHVMGITLTLNLLPTLSSSIKLFSGHLVILTMLLFQYALVAVTALAGVRATLLFGGHIGSLLPLGGYGGHYGLGLYGGMSYGHQYPLYQPAYIGGPAKVDELLHDFHTPVHHTKDVGRAAPPLPANAPLDKEVSVNPLPVHGRVQGPVKHVGYQKPLLRETGITPGTENPVYGGFRAPLPRDVGLHGPIQKGSGLNNPILPSGSIRPLGGLFNKGSVGVPLPHGEVDTAFVGKPSFGVVPNAFNAADSHKISGPFLTPVARYSDGYIYHRVPLALVTGGFVGHHFGTPVVHGIVRAGVPVSLVKGW